MSVAAPARAGVPVEHVAAAAYRVPTDAPESDGTYAWTSTTLVTVTVHGGGVRGFGWSYTSAAAGRVVHDHLAPVVRGCDAFATTAAWHGMREAVRNVGRAGIAACAISAVDVALWDLKATLLGVPLVDLLGAVRECIPIYGSGGFTSYDTPTLQRQLAGWAAAGCTRVKMKVGRDPAADPRRMRAARAAIGTGVELFIDANGALDTARALALAAEAAPLGVTWFEEPVSSDDLAALAHVRGAAPPGMAIAAGEYGWDPIDARRMLAARAVDVLQADATRCQGITGFLRIAALAEAANVPLSAHCAPALHAPLCCAVGGALHAEWFHDHARIEKQLMEGFPAPERGTLAPQRQRPGLGIALRVRDAQRYEV